VISLQWLAFPFSSRLSHSQPPPAKKLIDNFPSLSLLNSSLSRICWKLTIVCAQLSCAREDRIFFERETPKNYDCSLSILKDPSGSTENPSRNLSWFILALLWIIKIIFVSKAIKECQWGASLCVICVLTVVRKEGEEMRIRICGECNVFSEDIFMRPICKIWLKFIILAFEVFLLEFKEFWI
jgi:hypothetical protein